ncbi:MAG: hypothetical protein LIP09_10965 [Bacteroidales bacterium]|nr:hypothetical protein [Bacteroidales bacterium]
MITFKTTSRFCQSIATLLKVKRGVYSGIESEIRSEFQDKPMQELRANRDMVLMESDAIVIKLRIKDSKNRLSKANGFRLIYMAYKEIDEVVLMEVYPKRGPLQKIDLNENELEELVALVRQENKAQTLGLFQI